MAKVRFNKIIELLERGQPVFSCGTIPNGNYDEIMALSRSAYDMIILETEHLGFDFPTLRHSLQYLVNRKRIAEKGNLQPDVVPLVRIPPYTRERNEWVIKQTLDAGPYGLVLPHLDSVEGAEAAVRAARYPQVPGVPDFEPTGERGWSTSLAPHYWGLTPQEYYDAADVWPLDPDGELLPCACGDFLFFRGQRNGRVPHHRFLQVDGSWHSPPPIRAQVSRSCRPSTSRHPSTWSVF
jgi:4-hydroxy-2-oxoheptanedioate aldolase